MWQPSFYWCFKDLVGVFPIDLKIFNPSSATRLAETELNKSSIQITEGGEQGVCNKRKLESQMVLQMVFSVTL